jgi:hypothetical protein
MADTSIDVSDRTPARITGPVLAPVINARKRRSNFGTAVLLTAHAVPQVNRVTKVPHSPLAVPIVNRQWKCDIFMRTMTTATQVSIELLIWRAVDGTFRVELGGTVIARDIASIDHARCIARTVGKHEMAAAGARRRIWR